MRGSGFRIQGLTGLQTRGACIVGLWDCASQALLVLLGLLGFLVFCGSGRFFSENLNRVQFGG